MPVISNSTLQYAIESIAATIKELEEVIDEGDAMPEDYERLEKLDRAARELEEQYHESAKTVTNLVAYDKLVGR
jgi:prefoldin subunit 5